ncbi:rhombosortase [Neiella marina]|uniref:Rhombosortase n=1 Tax=Neiella marina TaxID=508461 RepID=A0A8J2U4B6_9GAMM|nr:rhombosortase [Neiella marina]GGA73738.1 rhombosortase [Neiella marina]
MLLGSTHHLGWNNRLNKVAILWQLTIPAAAAVAFWWWPAGNALLEYQASIPLFQQLWVLITAPLLHTNFYHLIMNIAAYGLIASLSVCCLASWRMPALTLLLGGLSTLGFALFNQQLSSLVGLSGALHGVVAYLIIREFSTGPKFMLFLAVGLVVKLLWEQFIGGSSYTATLIDANVAVLSHLAGAISGALLGISISVMSR